MSTELLMLAKDYNSLLDRVSSSLLSLKTELVAMRKQDVKLLKQLTQISDVIQTFCQNIKENKPTELISPDSAIDTTSPTSYDVTFDGKRRMPLVRQQSVPYYCGILRSQDSISVGSSFEDIMEDTTDSEHWQSPDNDNIFTMNKNEIYSVFGEEHWHLGRIRSLSMETPTRDTDVADDDYFENVLRKNIQLWKISENYKVTKDMQVK